MPCPVSSRVARALVVTSFTCAGFAAGCGADGGLDDGSTSVAVAALVTPDGPALPVVPRVQLPTRPFDTVADADALVRHASPEPGGLLWPDAASAAPVRGAFDPEQRARDLIDSWAARLGADPGAADTLVVRDVLDTGRGGIVVTFQQWVDGVPVDARGPRVLLRRDGGMVAMSGRVHPVADVRTARTIAPQDAALRALHTTVGTAPLRPAQVDRDAAGAIHVAVAPWTIDGEAAQLRVPARVREVLVPRGARLHAAWVVEVEVDLVDTLELRTARVVIDAATGEVLAAHDMSAGIDGTYRVYADAETLRPLAGPFGDVSPHPTGRPEGLAPDEIAAALVTVDGLNTNPDGASDPWLPAGATTTAGNNVVAWADLDGDRETGGGDVVVSVAGRVFDFPFGFDAEPADDQHRAASVAIFYVTNWLHDWYYDAGFDEAAGNAQSDNFGRGGESGDPLLAMVSMPGMTNNAVATTPDDGASPSLRFGVWSGRGEARVEADTVDDIAEPGLASFGPDNFDVSAPIVVARDAAGEPGDACEPITNDVAGSIALVDRGGCSFWIKVANAQSAGAVGVIIANNRDGVAPGMSGTPGVEILIPTLSVTDVDGGRIAAAVGSRPRVDGRLVRSQEPASAGAFDHMVVAHEWAHILTRRLAVWRTAQARALDEGWADLVALHMVRDEGDDPAGAWAIGVRLGHVLSTDPLYYGTRRVPTSTSDDINALRFRHIANGEPLPDTHPILERGDNALAANAGEVWARMLWEAYAALVGEVEASGGSFDDARRMMSDLTVAALVMSPEDPTFTEARDAFLAAARASDEDIVVGLAEAFARMGLGTCAEAPARDSVALDDLVESYVDAPNLVIQGVETDDGPIACDDDGIIDAFEPGVLRVHIANIGSRPATDVAVDIVGVLETPQIIEEIPPLSTYVYELAIGVGETGDVPGLSIADVSVAWDGGCVDAVEASHSFIVNADVIEGATARDDVEIEPSLWTIGGLDGDEVWSIVELEGPNHRWRGLDFGAPSDTWLTSPQMSAASDGIIGVTLLHRYRFEADDVFWDGGVIEVSFDEGGTWTDVAEFTDPGYDGVLSDAAGNPLAGRSAYSGESASWPDMQLLELAIEPPRAEAPFQLRFRIATDAAVGDEGWDIDDIEFYGVAETPFPRLVVDDGLPTCPQEPDAIAGPDQTVDAGDTVALDGTMSSDPDEGTELDFSWSQLEGTPVDLTGADLPIATFTAPDVSEEELLLFELAVSDGVFEVRDSVAITVRPVEAPDAGGEDTGGEDAGGQDTGGEDAGGEDTGGEDAGGTDTGAGADAGGSGDSGSGGGGGAATGGGSSGGCAAGGSSPWPSGAGMCIAGLALVTRRRRYGR